MLSARFFAKLELILKEPSYRRFGRKAAKPTIKPINMRKILFLATCLAFAVTTLSAQCPTSNRDGIHVVQYGQTLYRISKMYNVSIENLRAWNGMQFNELLQVCQNIRVNAPIAANTYQAPAQEVFVTRSAPAVQTTASTSYNSYQKQTGGRHVIKQGETIAGIARLYGYTEARFREFNVLNPGQERTPGSVLLTSDCACDRTSYAEDANGLFSGQWNEQLRSPNDYTPNPNARPAPASNYTNPFYTPPSSNRPPTYNQGNQGNQINQGTTSWGRVANQRNNTTTNNRPANNWNNTSNNNNWNRTPATNNGGTNQINNTGFNNRPATTATTNRPNPNAYRNELGKTSYLSQEEQTMINEINLVRSNPAGYVKYVEQYIKDIRSGKAFGSSTNVAYELIDELKRTPPLSILQPVECLYKAAQQHGQEAVRKGSSDHKGLDGSWPWDRAKRACPQMTDGNENLVGGPADVREAVMLLLVDDGISNRGHRKTLLNKEWKYVACYKTGMVGRMPNSWVQMFGY